MDKVNMCQIQKQIDNSKEEMMGVISFILAIFPLSFVINSYLVAMKNIGENQGTENIRTVFFYVLIFLIIGIKACYLMRILLLMVSNYCSKGWIFVPTSGKPGKSRV